jgi:acyl-CoA synthetase (AMP-forming)/AMP-acid ligase II
MEFLLDRFSSSPDRIAFIDDDRAVTYGAVVKEVNNFQAKIQAAGVLSGEVVCVVGDYSPEMFCFMLALIKNRNVFVPVTRESVVEKSAVLEISESQWVVEFPQGSGQLQFERLNKVVTNALLRQPIDDGRPGLILFSSGSTGKPKGILHDFLRVIEKFREPRKPVVAITFLMMDHFGGINTLLAITSSLGTVVTVKNRSVTSICETIQKHKVELLPTTPSFLNMLVRSGSHERYDLSTLKLITYGTEVMPQATLERLQVCFPGVKLQQTYGLSELGVLRSQSRPDGSLWVRIGGEGFQTKVVDEILWIKSQYAMLGYLNAPSPFDADGWFNTQDKVEVDGDYFRILGRVTDLMNIGGQKVYPAEIEEVILSLDNIEDVAVYAEKNTLLGNMVVARVVPKEPETVESLKKRIRKACSEKLAAFKVPAKVVLADRSIYSARLKKIRSDQKPDSPQA